MFMFKYKEEISYSNNILVPTRFDFRLAAWIDFGQTFCVHIICGGFYLKIVHNKNVTKGKQNQKFYL